MPGDIATVASIRAGAECPVSQCKFQSAIYRYERDPGKMAEIGRVS